MANRISESTSREYAASEEEEVEHHAINVN